MPAKKAKVRRSGKSASVYDVAQESGVSVFTVSAVVNNKDHVGKRLRERVEAAIQKLNYRPNLLARSLAKQKTHTIGMVVTDIANPFFPMVVRGAEDAAQKRGYNLLLCNSDDVVEKEARGRDLAHESGARPATFPMANDQRSEDPLRDGHEDLSQNFERRCDHR